MKTSFWQTLVIIIKSVWITLKYSCKIILHRRELSRAQLDQYARAWSQALLALPDLRYQVIYHPLLQLQADRCYIIMSNHSSLYDIPLLLLNLPGSIRMLAKKELFRIPLWGQAMKRGEFVAIDRKNRTQALKDLALAAQKMQSGIMLWVSPEGTRSRSGQLLPFKKGGFMLALQTQAIIIPVGIRGAAAALPAKSLQFKLHQHAEVHIGAAIDTRAYSLATRQQLMTTVAAAISHLAAIKPQA